MIFPGAMSSLDMGTNWGPGPRRLRVCYPICLVERAPGQRRVEAPDIVAIIRGGIPVTVQVGSKICEQRFERDKCPLLI